MNTKIILVVMAVIAVTSATENYRQMYTTFKAQYNRKFASAVEDSKRFKIFVQNMKTAAELQALNPHARFGVNEFADMSAEEFKIRHSAEKYYAKRLSMAKDAPLKYTKEELDRAPQSVDWRAQGAVTQVKNQGQCGSCWSFSTTGGIEGQWAIAGNPLTSLSEQELVSCDSTNNGCNGGMMDTAFEWIISNQGGNIVTSATYPYVSGNGEVPGCSLGGTTVGATISSYQDLPHSESQMAAWCGYNGPVSIAVDATSWQTYQGGVLTNCVSQQLDHGVLIVGYDLSSNPPYWIIKNSWGPSWGEEGYIRVLYGQNECLINNYPTHPIV